MVGKVVVDDGEGFVTGDVRKELGAGNYDVSGLKDVESGMTKDQTVVCQHRIELRNGEKHYQVWPGLTSEGRVLYIICRGGSSFALLAIR